MRDIKRDKAGLGLGVDADVLLRRTGDGALTVDSCVRRQWSGGCARDWMGSQLLRGVGRRGRYCSGP